MRAHDNSKERADREREVLRKLSRVLAEEARGGVLGEALDALLECRSLESGGAFTVESTYVTLVAERALAPGRAGTPASAHDLRGAVTFIAERVRSTRKPVKIVDLGASELTSALRNDLAARGIRAVLAQPLKHQREVLGVLVLLAHDPAAFDSATSALVETAGHMLALAIERDRRGEREASYRDELVQTGNMAMLGVLTASVAHDLRATSGAIAAHLGEQTRVVGDLGESATDWTRPMIAELAERLAEMTVASTEMSTLVGHLNNVSRRHSLAEKLDLSTLTREGLCAGKSELRRRGVALVEDYTAGCMVAARRDNVVRVVLSLLFNAVDASTSTPHPHPQVTVRTRLDGDRVVLSVDDTGARIPEEELHAVFEPLYASTERGQRTGLGLKVCSDVVSVDHGNIEVKNLDAGGVSFRISLPYAATVSAPCCSPSDLPTDPPPAEHVDIRRVFIVDDDDLFIRTLKRALKPHDVRSAATASEAEMVLLDPAYTPHVVLCDVGLPGITGDVLHARVASKRPLIARRFVFVTGGACTREEADYLRKSGCATLQKPFTTDAIWDAVVSAPVHDRALLDDGAAPVDESSASAPTDAPRRHRYSDLPTLPPDTVDPAV